MQLSVNLLKNRLSVISLILFATILALSLFAKAAFADAYTLSGRVSDASGNNISGATVAVIDPNTNANVGTITTDNVGNYTLSIAAGVYNVQVSPLSGSNFSSTIALNQNISGNKILNFVLTPTGVVTINGHIYDPQGNLLPNQNISLRAGSNTIASTTTDNNGFYSLSVAAATYDLFISFVDTNHLYNIAGSYTIRVNSYTITQSITDLDITLPLKKIDVHVQDSSGNAVSGAQLTTNNPGGVNDLNIGGGITTATGFSFYNSPGPITDQQGNATLWLFPNNYSFTVTPPSGSEYSITSVSKNITSDTSLIITMLQPVIFSGYLHDALGNVLPNQNIRLDSGSTTVATTTSDSTGFYSLSVALGTYNLFINYVDTNNSYNIARNYTIRVNNFVLSQNATNQNITLPFKKVNVHVKNAAGQAISGISLTTNNPGGVNDLNIGGGITTATGFSFYGSPGTTTDSSGNATLWLFPNNYSFTATPPSGSIYSTTTLSNNITNDTNLEITMQQPVIFSGYLHDALGNVLPNQNVTLSKLGTTIASTTTNSTGFYSLSVSAGIYDLFISYVDTNNLYSIPRNYTLRVNNFALNQDTTNLNLTLPLKKVDVHVQDAAGNAVSGIQLTTNNPGGVNDLNIGGGIITATGFSFYGSPGTTTDASGNATLWLFPNTYTFNITPLSGSIYLPFTLSNINVTSDQTQVISLQYNHAAPVSTVALATEHEDGTYGNPTTVTLSATAASGYTVATTYYKVDGGAQQIYTAPFNVSGDGQHTVEYWSVDNSGVPEAHKTKTFTIYVNQAPDVDPVAGGTINAGGTFTASSSFTDPDSTSWTATVDYGEGAGPESLALNPDKTFSLSHQYTTAGTYTVTVVVRDEAQATGTTMATVVVNGAPEIATLSGVNLNKGQTYTESGTFTDSDSTYWTAIVNYGDGSGEQSLPLDGNTFALNHTYNVAGKHTVTVKVTDDQGAVGTKTTTVVVNAPAEIGQLTGASINKDGTYTENGSFTDADSTSWIATVDYGDGAGEQNLSLTGTDFSLSHQYTTAGTFTVTVKVTDNQSAVATKTASVHVNDVPQLNPLTSASIPEGATYAVPGSFTDVDSTSWIATVDYGDGSGVQPLTLSGTDFALSHVYQDNGEYTITVAVTDNQGLSDTREAIVTVNNLAASVGDITASINPVQVNTAITASASFTDPGVLDTHTAVWNWGDGTTSNATLTESNGSGAVTDTHTYTAAGVYEITLTVTDNNGGVATKVFQYLTVFNPNAGWASGGKEFISPAGAVTGNAGATGKVDFGFQVKYHNGDLVPSGKNFSLSFPTGNIEFESTEYEWLVVDGSKATFKADGVLNGIPGYTVLVSVIEDSGNGLLRVQIKNSNGDVVYDTQLGALDTANPTNSVSKGKINVH